MSLEEYTNQKRDDALVYWLEHRLKDLGGISGGSAFKFGIFRRTGKGKKSSAGGRMYNKRYLWQGRFGQTPEEAFTRVRQALVDIIDAAQARRLEAIDDVPLGNAVKWKVAFLYQDRNDPKIFPIYKRDTLFHHYKKSVSPGASPRKTPYSLMYQALSVRLHRLDVFQRADELWTSWKTAQAPPQRSWLLPLPAFGLTEELAAPLLARTTVHGDELPLPLKAQFSHHQVQPGDKIALLDEDHILARGVIAKNTPDDLSWEQESCRIPLSLDLSEAPAGLLEVTDWRTRDFVWGNHQQAPQISKTPLEPCPPPSNQIFYGPPGTGKTFRAARRALELCGISLQNLSGDQINHALAALQAEGRVEIVTFHPSYTYEDFVEGIRPVMGIGQDLGYRCVDGVFKTISLLASSEGLPAKQDTSDFDYLWESLLAMVDQADEDFLVEGLHENLYTLLLNGRGELEARRVLSVEQGEAWVDEKKQIVRREIAEALWEQRDLWSSSPKPEGDALKQMAHDALGTTRGVFPNILWPVLKELLKLAQRPRKSLDASKERIARVREFMRTGRAGDLHFHAKTPGYVLLIDEINRGNLGAVLGELITLLEPERRLGASDALSVRLPTSQETFSVPPNLHILGTMNTADRSIALLDVALRRRFFFEEQGPQVEALEKILVHRGAAPDFAKLMATLMRTLNERIEFLYDRDHLIGQAYFLQATDPENARITLTERIIPLLQEYFYNAWDRICLVLGCPYDDRGRPLRDALHAIEANPLRYKAPLIKTKTSTERDILGIRRGDFEPRQRYTLNPLFQTPASTEEIMKMLQAVLHAPVEVLEDAE